MSKETINTFTKGMVCDFSPLTTPNNVLTHALNATLITMNGNEYILQNDMGNGRVESAYLPSGYVPLGVKEYGGVIYVVSYNPITGKGQIGSFPSPERNITSEELNKSPITFDSSDFIENKTTIVRKALFSDDLVIRPGDHFLIYINNINNSEISNCQNVDNSDQIEYIKNNRITFKVCVLDKNNNLFDVTSSLKRYNGGKVIPKGTTPTNVYVNKGYYAIQGEIQSGTTNLTEYRKLIKSDPNIYNNKLVGQLYIQAELNTLQYFDVGVDGEKVDKEKYKLYFETDWKYNCPDGGSGDQIYGQRTNKCVITGADISIQPNKKWKTIDFIKTAHIGLSETLQDGKANREYNAIDNLYEQRQLNILEYSGSGKISYAITPKDELLDTLDNLTVKGSINLDKLGSGEVTITTWKYFKNDEYMLLNWGLEAYPRHNEKFSNLTFQFFEFYNTKFNDTPDYEYIVSNKRNYNGTFSDPIHLPDWYDEKYNGKARARNRLFLCRIIVTTNSNIPIKDSKLKDLESITKDGKTYYILGYRWIFNTTLYNEAYYRVVVMDWGDKDSNNTDTDPTYLGYYRKVKLNIKHTVDKNRSGVTVSKNNKTIKDNSETVTKSTSQQFSYSITNTKEYVNEDIYPFYRDIRDVEESYVIPTDKTKYKFSASLTYGQKGTPDESAEEIVNQNNLVDNITLTVKALSLTISANVGFYSRLTNGKVIVKHAMRPIIASMKDVFGYDNFNNDSNIVVPVAYSHGVRGKDRHQVGLAQIPLGEASQSQGWDGSRTKAIYLTDWGSNRYDFEYGTDDYKTFGINSPNSVDQFWPEAIKALNKQGSDEIIVMMSADGFNGGYGENDVYYSKGSLQKTDEDKFNYQCLLWRDVDDNYRVSDCYIYGYTLDIGTGRPAISMVDYIFNKYNTLYQYSEGFSNTNINYKILTDDYIYNNSYKLNFSFNFEYTLHLKTIPDYYTNVATDFSNSATKKMITFTDYKQDNPDNINQSESINVEGFEEYFIKRHNGEFDWAIVLGPDTIGKDDIRDIIELQGSYKTNVLYDRDGTFVTISQFKETDDRKYRPLAKENIKTSPMNFDQLIVKAQGDSGDNITILTFCNIPAFETKFSYSDKPSGSSGTIIKL